MHYDVLIPKAFGFKSMFTESLLVRKADVSITDCLNGFMLENYRKEVDYKVKQK